MEIMRSFFFLVYLVSFAACSLEKVETPAQTFHKQLDLSTTNTKVLGGHQNADSSYSIIYTDLGNTVYIKLDGNGNPMINTQKQYDNNNVGTITHCSPDSGEGMLLVGYRDLEAMTIKMDAKGMITWKSGIAYSSDPSELLKAVNAIKKSDGNYFICANMWRICGSLPHLGVCLKEGWVYELNNSNGDPITKKGTGTTDICALYDVIQRPSGEYFGIGNNFTQNKGIVFQNSGSKLFSQKNFSHVLKMDGDQYIVASDNSLFSYDPVSDKMSVIKEFSIDSISIVDLFLDNDDKIVFTGLNKSHIFAQKISRAGETIWTEDYSDLQTQGNLTPVKIVPTQDKGLMILCNYEYNNETDIYLIKTDDLGKVY